ncbi:Putative LacI family transcriptional regulator [Leuconostoc citreum LBAE C11]|nr:Putative LacI family transcriptional regulator [Leuconostoc citreum LBAE C11]
MNYKLEDVAEIAGVSKTTVSRVINKRGYLSQSTVDKVNNAMAELNYQPNAAAQQLQKKKQILLVCYSHPLQILFLVNSSKRLKKNYIKKDIRSLLVMPHKMQKKKSTT